VPFSKFTNTVPVAEVGNDRRYDAMKPFSYRNKLGQAYYLHLVRLAGGRNLHVMRTQAEGALAKLPADLEIRENVHGHVSVRRLRPPRFTGPEQKMLRTALKHYRPFAYELDIDDRAATVYASAEDRKCFLESLDAEFAEGFADALAKALAKRYSPELMQMFRARREQQKSKQPRYYPLLRFVIVDPRDRRFAVERVCFTGEHSWLRLELLPLSAAVMKYLPHLGQDSFFDLI
jgi:hypothetical protein